MVVAIIILVCSFLLDGILSNFLPYMIGDLSLFTPMFTIVSLVIVYPFFIKKLRYYFIGCFAIGICYDFMYTNLLFYNAILFTIIGILVFFYISIFVLHGLACYYLLSSLLLLMSV